MVLDPNISFPHLSKHQQMIEVLHEFIFCPEKTKRNNFQSKDDWRNFHRTSLYVHKFEKISIKIVFDDIDLQFQIESVENIFISFVPFEQDRGFLLKAHR